MQFGSLLVKLVLNRPNFFLYYIQMKMLALSQDDSLSVLGSLPLAGFPIEYTIFYKNLGHKKAMLDCSKS